MGFVRAFTGAIGGVLADQWQDFLTAPQGLGPTVALAPVVPQGTNAGRGVNVRGSVGVISNGSRILVPQGFGLITFQDGRITGFIAEPGGYIWAGDAPDSASVFAGQFGQTLVAAWNRFRFGGRPSGQQAAYVVNLKEMPGNRFGTQSEVYWDDSYLGAQAGAIARGTYSLRIVDPLLFVGSFVPASFYTAPGAVLDLADPDNPAGDQLFQEVVASLAAAFSRYTNDADREHRITRIQGDAVGFGAALGETVEQEHHWREQRGLEIVRVAIASIEYDARTRDLLEDVQKADALGGNRSASFLNQSVARGVEAAGQTGGAAGLGMLGMSGGSIGGLVQPVAGGGAGPVGAGADAAGSSADGPSDGPADGPSDAADDPVERLARYKRMLDEGLITPEDYEAAKKKALGL